MAQAELQEKQGNAPEYSGNYDVVGQEMEKHRKRRKRGSETVEDVEEENRGGEAEGFLLRDPLEVFRMDIMLMILSNLDARSVALSLLVSRTWRGVASSDRIWGLKGAPEYWRNLDPYWKGTGRLMRRYFRLDGSQSADPDDKVWGGHECCYLTVTSIVGEDRIREHYVRINRWPRLSVSRKRDWSWELSNHLYSYSSIPDADKEGGTGPLYEVM